MARNETNSLDDTRRSQGVEVLYDPVTEALEQEAAAIKAEVESVIAKEADSSGRNSRLRGNTGGGGNGSRRSSGGA